jgi:glycosyltransferase involved in cell wall biosynthesis
MALISIVMPTFNGGTYIRACVESCLNQTFEDLELIVVVDGSTDDTEEILSTYTDPRLRTVKTENRGQAQAMNTGFEIAGGKYWSWTSDDNVYMTDAFEVMAHHLNSHPDDVAVSTDGLIIDHAGNVTNYEEFDWQCFLFRAEAAQKTGPHRKEARILEDMDFFIRLRHYAGPVGRISRPYIKYRLHDNMTSRTRIRERPLMSAKLNYEYIEKGMLETDMKEMFLDRLSQCSLHNAYDTMDKILEFALEKRVPFLDVLEARSRYLRSPAGWFLNRSRIAFLSRFRSVIGRLKLLAYLLAKSF